MKLYRSILVCATIVLTTACDSQSTSECRQNNPTASGIPTEMSSPDPIPGSAKMSTILGPLAPDFAKWGPSEIDPFSWPGKVEQHSPTYPATASEQLIYEVRLPASSLLYKVHVWVDPPNGHSAVPASRAQTMLFVHNGGFDEFDLVAATVTLGDSVPNYEQRYLLTMDLDEPHEMKADERVFVYVFGEWGDSFMPGLIVDTPEIVYDSP